MQDRVPAERRAAALARLKKYAGTEKDYRPIAELALEDMEREWKQNPDRLAPFKDEVERSLSSSPQLIEEIGVLFEKYEIKGFEKDYKKLQDQVKSYEDFLRETILPGCESIIEKGTVG